MKAEITTSYSQQRQKKKFQSSILFLYPSRKSNLRVGKKNKSKSNEITIELKNIEKVNLCRKALFNFLHSKVPFRQKKRNRINDIE